jgi:Peptidase S46
MPAAPPATVASEQPSVGQSPASATKPAFENQGGMWMPEQLPAQAQTLKALGLELDPQALATPTSDVLQSVISLGGCSASFVSAEGLIATNHHCALGALQYNATAKDNVLSDGYIAKTRADEKWNGPTSKVYVTQSSKDVTKDIRDGLEAIVDNLARFKRIEARSKAIVAGCEKARAGIRCSVTDYFGGAQYRLIEQLEIRDVRLVFAPHEAVGAFGGEIDNWRWPRHSGDIAMFRAYVGKDGKPADYSPDNVPYAAPHHLKLASKPLKQGDLVLVAGYPGRTNRLRTAQETDEAVSWYYPRTIAYMEQNAELLERLGETSADLKIKATPMIRGFRNYITKNRGIVEGLVKGGFAAEKLKGEMRLREWIAAEPARKAAYGDVLEKLAAISVETQRTRESDAWLGELARVPLLASATAVVRMAEERPKADSARDPAFQERLPSARSRSASTRSSTAPC